MLHQPLLSVCPEAACNESTLSSSSSASIRRRKSHSHLCLCWHYLKRLLHWICSTGTQEQKIIGAVKFFCLATALTASNKSCMAVHVCWECKASEPWLYSSLPAGAHQHSSIKTSYKIWHHENESTSLNVSITIFSVSIALFVPLLSLYLFSSPQLPVFCTFRLFSLHLSLPFPCLFPPPAPPFLLSAIPLSAAECGQIYVSGQIWAELSQHHTQEGRRFTERHNALRKTSVLHILLPLSVSLASQSLTTFLASVHSCATSFPSHTFPLKINTGCLLLTWYKCCHILAKYFWGC